MTYYLDDDCRVHTDPGEGRTPWEDADGVFDGKCKAYAEGFRVIPEGRSWTREDGTVFNGFMLSPLTEVRVLNAVQAEFELAQAEMDDMRSALELLGVTPIE